jgi:hypothetical protein
VSRRYTHKNIVEVEDAAAKFGYGDRVAPGVIRAFEAGDDGLEVLAFGPRRTDDRGEILHDWWQD